VTTKHGLNEAQYTGRYAHEFTSFAAAVNLRTTTSGPNDGYCAREFIILEAAASDVLNVTLSDGTAKAFGADVLVGIAVPLCLATLEISTLTGSVLVIW
jgi:hypothetical protein